MAFVWRNKITGELEEPTARQLGAEVRKMTGWSAEKYAKEYDKLRNRARAYEKAAGYKGHINVAELLYEEAKGKNRQRAGVERYERSSLRKAVDLAPSLSTGASAQKAIDAYNRSIERVKQTSTNPAEERRRRRLRQGIFEEQTQPFLLKSKTARQAFEIALEKMGTTPAKATIEQKRQAIHTAKEAFEFAKKGKQLTTDKTQAETFAEKYGFDPTEY